MKTWQKRSIAGIAGIAGIAATFQKEIIANFPEGARTQWAQECVVKGFSDALSNHYVVANIGSDYENTLNRTDYISQKVLPIGREDDQFRTSAKVIMYAPNGDATAAGLAVYFRDGQFGNAYITFDAGNGLISEARTTVDRCAERYSFEV